MTNRPIEILLVEDNEDDILIIQEVFSDVKLATIINFVRDGEEALAYLRRTGKFKVARTPDLVLLDINMPKKNGFEVLEEIKTDVKLQSMPVVMLTMSHREEDVVRSYGKGACSYIQKRLDLDQFKQIVQQFERYWTGVAKLPVTNE